MITRIALLSALLLFGRWSLASAQSGLSDASILTNEAIVSYPNSVTFELSVDPAVTLVDAVLTYDVMQASCLDVSTRVPVAVDGPDIRWEWAMVRSGNPPPGAALWWEWTLTDDQGNTFTTPRKSLTFSDDRFDWQSVARDDITIHWYAGEGVGPLLLDAAVAGVATLETEMGIDLQQPVEFYIYGSSEDMRAAVLYVQDWAGGVAFPEYNVILMGVPPAIAADWGVSTVRHELAHLVVGQFGQSCVGGRRPTWLEEGLATYAEGEPSEQVLNDIENGRRSNSFAPLRSLNGAFPAHGGEANAAYSQSYSVVDFLRSQYGVAQLQNYLLLLAEGSPYDAALEAVYGFNTDGLEAAWRTWMQLPPRVYPPTPTPLSAANVPTVAPLAGPVSVPTPPDVAALPPQVEPTTPAADASPGISVCGIGLMPLAGVGLVLAQRKRGRRDAA